MPLVVQQFSSKHRSHGEPHTEDFTERQNTAAFRLDSLTWAVTAIARSNKLRVTMPTRRLDAC